MFEEFRNLDNHHVSFVMLGLIENPRWGTLWNAKRMRKCLERSTGCKIEWL